MVALHCTSIAQRISNLKHARSSLKTPKVSDVISDLQLMQHNPWAVAPSEVGSSVVR
jgi:hypothetical protein